ncbi:hypothetical protein QEG60_004022 [Pluralibacter gergoviae]|mgnify:CR=1 FL=1|uniref:hypothetical protein n=1 Tax=Pluralibacter gergoviae TaxID=61647 RepID=UPI000A365B9D|nr:hypothetical protein [Pluralibacter gergoviae]EKT9641761.1 hypothetical protein [Pluralibacter gergoviae]EKV3545276.1 hypothetical protein [Pluralibacter gergoviae]EKV9898202.1 hypothetical protein [Pluralibacter gergoviae]EKV9930525.1 hypothetical protein [Pluralibacter gergoviae]ELO7478259.1 hypothetical protein [Pluralibacter gergoviae]
MVNQPVGLLQLVAQNAWMFSCTSIVLVFVGWKVTYSNSSRLATRSETKSLVDALAKIVNDIADVSIDFWINKCQNGQASAIYSHGIKIQSKRKQDKSTYRLFEMNVFAKMNQAYKYISLLEARGIDFDNSWLSLYPEKVTLDCESAHQMDLSVRATRVQEILGVSQDTMNMLYEAFQKSHPPSKGMTIVEYVKKERMKIDEWLRSLN